MSKAIFDALANQDIDMLKQQSKKPLIDSLDEYGYSLLHISISKSYDEISLLLIDEGINPNLKDKNGQTPLHYAAFYNKISIAKQLLEKGADINIKDNYGNQPLWTAVFNDKGFGNRLEIIELFLGFNADVNHTNNAGKSPIDFAKSANYTSIATMLSRQ